uniref:lytic polysaccharide monooxygenase n=1 Tax=Thaumasiovibrio occultus TaxID=1891184 RepID=UPI000B35234A|nr:lytic polysaccharide monooxygenase [Thaumasiovibrio occultus]
MMYSKRKLALAATSLYFLIPAMDAQAHGWSEFPEARQSICYEQGGLWSGSPPNAACAQAKDISGQYPFIQRSEFAINISDYNNMDAVRAAVPDGTLCYANDKQKAGMGAPHTGWTRTEVSAGTFEYIFNAVAPHNPSFWQFYLTKPNADLSKALAWSDVELIQENGDVPVVNGKYRIDVTIPTDRQGDAILFVRWQRDDAAGEGFYNCSDITIVNDTVTPPVEPTQPYLVQGTQFIPADITLATPALGDSVNYQIFNKLGELHSSFSLVVTAENQNDWDRLLAAQVNGWYEANHKGNVYIGRWHQEMNHYMYFRNDLHNNFFNSRDSRATAEFTITKAPTTNLDAVISPMVLAPLNDATVTHGEYVVLGPKDSKGNVADVQWTQTSGTPVMTEVNASNELIIDTAQLTNERHELTFKLTVFDASASDEMVYSFVVEPAKVDVIPPTPPTPPTTPEPSDSTWSKDQVYFANDTVVHKGKTWTAQWWTSGEEPGTTGDWGVWR